MWKSKGYLIKFRYAMQRWRNCPENRAVLFVSWKPRHCGGIQKRLTGEKNYENRKIRSHPERSRTFGRTGSSKSKSSDCDDLGSTMTLPKLSVRKNISFPLNRIRVNFRRSLRRRWLHGFGSAREAPSPKLRLRYASLRMTHKGKRPFMGSK